MLFPRLFVSAGFVDSAFPEPKRKLIEDRAR